MTGVPTPSPFPGHRIAVPYVLVLLVLVPLVLGGLVGWAVRGPELRGAADDPSAARTGVSGTLPSPGTSPRLAVIGDSWSCGVGSGDGSGLSEPEAGFVGRAARELGWPHEIACLGGTGYTTRHDPFSSRAGEVIAFAPDVVLLQGSTNDDHAPGRRIRSDAESLLRTLGTALPDARLFVMGPAYSPAVDGASVDRGRAALRAAAGSADATWLDVATSGVLEGEDFADGVHPDRRGHVLLGRWLADELER